VPGDLVTDDWVRRRAEADGHAAMNAAIRGPHRVVAADQPEAVVGDWDGGVRGSPSAPAAGMNEHLRADLAARRRRREDYA
jgi:hypothetical protein